MNTPIHSKQDIKRVNALLPMKGHSERVSNKNILVFAGLPLYHHVAQILQESELVQNIIINTDSESIAKDATEHFSKVRIINRPEAICGDFVPMNDIIAHDLSVVEGEHFLQTHSTNPLLTRTTLDHAIREYFALTSEHDSLFTVTKLQTRLYWEDGTPVNHNPEELLRTQDLPPLFEENSNIYLFSKKSFAGAGNRRIGRRPKMFIMNEMEAIDIDTKEKFMLAEAVYHLNHSQNQKAMP